MQGSSQKLGTAVVQPPSLGIGDHRRFPAPPFWFATTMVLHGIAASVSAENPHPKARRARANTRFRNVLGPMGKVNWISNDAFADQFPKRRGLGRMQSFVRPVLLMPPSLLALNLIPHFVILSKHEIEDFHQKRKAASSRRDWNASHVSP